MKTLKPEQFSVLTSPYLHYTLEYALDSIAANGFGGVELWGASPHFCIDDYTPKERFARIQSIRQMLKERGLKLTVFHPEQCRQYPINIASPIAYVRRCSMDVMCAYLEDTIALGADQMFLAPGWEYVDAQNEDNFKRAAESIQILDEKARTLGVRLLMEEMGATSTLFVRDLAHLERMIKTVGSDNISACLDMVLAGGNQETIEDYYTCFGSIGHVHFADAGTEGYAALGHGSGAAEEQLQTLAEKEYDGGISISLWGAGFFKDPDKAMRQCSQWLRECKSTAFGS